MRPHARVRAAHVTAQTVADQTDRPVQRGRRKMIDHGFQIRHIIGERAEWLAQHWAEQKADGRWHLRADPAHKMPFPTVYRLDEAIAIWSHVTAPTLWLGASESAAKQWNGYTDDTIVPTTKEGHAQGSFDSRLAAFSNIQFEVIRGAGHMLHHDVPENVAARVEAHLLA